ncbi:tyrosine-type recombinase/integrase [Micromonospora tulbaghiae]|uniref:tyrosine-type recombinase/integrase n=1 Tax=Micromonospora tulbaghiae TaxID=479978 RepID=UPI0036C01BA4
MQRLRDRDTGLASYTVVGPDGLPVEPVEMFLAHLQAMARSPNTIAGYAHDLRDFVEWLDQVGRDFRVLSLEELTGFFSWLARPVAARAPEVFVLPSAPPAIAPATLVRKRAALATFYRFHARRDASVPALLGASAGPRATGEFLPMLVHTRRARPGLETLSPIRIAAPRSAAVVLSDAQVARLVAACVRRRDRFLLILLDQTGLRSGEALGLRHADLRLRAGEVRVVPREGNVNAARVKGLKARVVPAGAVVFDAYADYMEMEYGALDSDWVFVNLFRPPVGAPMTAGAVAKLVVRLRQRTGIAAFTPHVLRHGYATRLLRAGVPVEVVAELLGHASTTTTSQIYSHLSVEDHRRALQSAGVLA